MVKSILAQATFLQPLQFSVTYAHFVHTIYTFGLQIFLCCYPAVFKPFGAEVIAHLKIAYFLCCRFTGLFRVPFVRHCFGTGGKFAIWAGAADIASIGALLCFECTSYFYAWTS